MNAARKGADRFPASAMLSARRVIEARHSLRQRTDLVRGRFPTLSAPSPHDAIHHHSLMRKSLFYIEVVEHIVPQRRRPGDVYSVNKFTINPYAGGLCDRRETADGQVWRIRLSSVADS